MDPHRDTLRILVATDSHLGYLEKDELRGRDSFDSFDEVCAIAAEKEVDLLLLGGDLFHENKPSRTTLVRTIEILRRYCLNDRPVQFRVVSDQTVNFPNRYGHVNYEDPNFNVGLPVFSIHGNHDDPSGVDNLSAIDILASCNLLNYFGKVDLEGDAVGQVTLHPILLRKGSAKVALYGLGNIRDERLNRMFQTPHGVQWIRPASQDDCSVSDWFNVFVIHQNRIKANPKNAINEFFLARFLDFVIWGHEHECLVDPQEVPGMGFHVTQPGSSVATSLIEGEAAPKHVLLLEIKGKEYRGIKIPLQSVRPFLFADVCLKDNPDIDPNDPESVLEFLTQKVNSMIAEVPTKEATPPALQVPLIRLRVDYSGYSTINAQRFGQRFVGKVANPNDILLFTKAARARRTKEDQNEEAGTFGPEELNQENIEALVAESNPKMEILPVTELGMALHDFVNKDEKQAFHVCVQDNLDRTQTKLAEEGTEKLKEEKDVVERVTVHMQQREAEGMLHRGDAAADNEDQPKTTGRRGVERKFAGEQSSLQDFSDDEEIMIPKGRGKTSSNLSAGNSQVKIGGAAARGTRAGGRGSRGAIYKQTTLNLMGTGGSQSQAAARAVLSSAETSTLQSVAESDDDHTTPAEDPESEEIEVPTRGRKRAARGRGGKAQEPRAKRGRQTATPAPSYIEDDVEDDAEYEPTQSRTRGAAGTDRARRRNYGALRR